MDIVRERTLRPPTPDSPAPIDGVEPPPLPTAVPPTPPTLPEYEIPVSKGYGPLRLCNQSYNVHLLTKKQQLDDNRRMGMLIWILILGTALRPLLTLKIDTAIRLFLKIEMHNFD